MASGLSRVSGCEDAHADRGWDHFLGQGIQTVEHRESGLSASMHSSLWLLITGPTCPAAPSSCRRVLPTMTDCTPDSEPKYTLGPLSCFGQLLLGI